MKKSAIFFLATAAFTAVGSVQASTYPDKSITIVVPTPPGGFIDMIARLTGARLAEHLEVSVIIVNRGGGGSTIGEGYVAKAKPDGYTLLATGRDVTLSGELYSNLPYDPATDFSPVSQLVWSPMVLVAHPSSKFASIPELVQLARARPGEITFASPGNGTGAHLAMEMMSDSAGMKLLHVPYGGAGQAANGVLGGHVSVMFLQMAVARPQILAGNLKALAVSSAERSAGLPDVPTVGESLGEGFDVTPWFGILSPGGTPIDIRERLANAFAEIMETPAVREKLAAQGVIPVGNNPAEFEALIAQEVPKWAKVIEQAGIKVN